MQQWEFMYLATSTSTGGMKQLMDEANKLGSLGWEPVGVASADRTIGLNSNMIILKRPIENPPPPPDSAEEWQADPTGRFDKRRWHAALGVWTAETAMMEAKTRHIDAPKMPAT